MKTIFLSYCSVDSDVADVVESGLINRLGDKVHLSRYTRDVHYRDSFKEFMDGVRDYDYVLAIVSDSYLKSSGCLYEIGEVLKERDYKERLHFVVLRESDEQYYTNLDVDVAAKVFSANDRMQYLMFWQKKYQEHLKAIEQLADNESQISERKELARIRRILDYDLPTFMEYLNEHRGARLSGLIATDFEDIVVSIYPDAADVLGIHSDLRGLLSAAIEKIAEITGTDYNQIMLLAKTESHQLGLVVFADKIAGRKQKYRITVVDGIVSHAYATNQTVYLDDVSKDPQYFSAVLETQSELAVPIIIGRRTVGIINSESEAVSHYTNELIYKMEFLAGKIASQLEKCGYYVDMDYRDVPYISL